MTNEVSTCSDFISHVMGKDNYFSREMFKNKRPILGFALRQMWAEKTLSPS